MSQFSLHFERVEIENNIALVNIEEQQRLWNEAKGKKRTSLGKKSRKMQDHPAAADASPSRLRVVGLSSNGLGDEAALALAAAAIHRLLIGDSSATDRLFIGYSSAMNRLLIGDESASDRR